uniref:Uncharacterized protein n=1 Tax=Marseillevirus sp. TaxID=2809551 RepID=A0AA96ERT7_9VIRU|nr:hypothetical protein MarFTMF_005 [Marseillevirus sp.]
MEKFVVGKNKNSSGKCRLSFYQVIFPIEHNTFSEKSRVEFPLLFLKKR